MKHLSLWLTVILLGAMPLAAAAFDYGPNPPLLASDSSGPPLPGTQLHATGEGDTPHGDVVAPNSDDSGTPAPDSPATRPQALAPPLPASHPHRTPTASSKAQPQPVPTKPLPADPQATWQSLLPGSIQ